MALTTKNYLDLTGLQAYDTLIKNYIDTGDAKAIKTVLWDSTNEQINFYKKENATSADTPDYSVSISSSDVQDLQARVGMTETLNAYQSETDLTSIMNVLTGDAETTGSVAKIAADEADAAESAANGYTDSAIAALDADLDASGTAQHSGTFVVSGVTEVDGVITAVDSVEVEAAGAAATLEASLAAVAKSGDATDVAFTAGQGSTIAATDVNTAINELESDIKDTITEMNGTATIATASNGVVTLKSGVAQTAGEIANDSGSDITLAKVATTGTAADVAIVDQGGLITATDVEGAIAELAQASAGGVASKTVYLQDESIGQSDYAKVYKLYQGANPPSALTDPAALIGTINIPKDLVVQSGSVVQVFYNDDDHLLHEGSVSGPDVTDYIVPSSGTPSAQYEGKYIKLIIQNQAAPLFIAVKDLVDVYTGGQTDTVTVSIDGNNVITANVRTIQGYQVVIPEYTQCHEGQAYDSETDYYAWNGNVYVAAFPSQAEFEADPTQFYTESSQGVDLAFRKLFTHNLFPNESIEGVVRNRVLPDLATSSDVAVATYTAGTGGAADKITFTGSITEANGVIDEGTADSIELSNITTAQINALFA